MSHRFKRSFKPAFHPEELLAYSKLEKPGQRIFVCDASDMFGKWVPDLWIELVLTACRCADKQRFIFLTKNPGRYVAAWDFPEEALVGTSMTGGDSASKERLEDLFEATVDEATLKWVSLEPLISDPTGIDFSGVDWVVIGAMTGRYRAQYPCKDIWVEEAINNARKGGARVYIKGELVGKFPVRELP
jgi:protein gp37